MQYFWALYLQSDTEHRNNYTAFPMLTPREILAEFPPTTVILAKHDVLLDEGLAFRDRLKEAGVSVNSVVYNSTVHAFFSRFGPGQEALQLTIESFKKVHA